MSTDPTPATSPWPPADRPHPDTAAERFRVACSAREGNAAAVLAALSHPEDRVRASAVRGLLVLEQLDIGAASVALIDQSYRVRRTLAEAGAAVAHVDLVTLLEDLEPVVVEAACWSAGERGAAAMALVGLLASISAEHDDPLCRESAVAALGAIGEIEGLPAILAATKDRATVRRRAILALAPFDSPEVSAALESALEDRDWQVRQAAEDLM